MSDRNTEVTDIDPFMDTGKAAREVLRMVKDVLKKEDEILHHQREFCEKWDREHGKPKIDGWKFLRNLAQFVTGEIDKRTK